MRNSTKAMVAGVLAVLIAPTLPVASAQAECAKINATRPGEVYLWRGLANIFSLGMDEMGKQFSKLGIDNCVYNHSGWKGAAHDLVERSKVKNGISYPVVIIGHSLGAGVSPVMATYLAERGIPVSYVVMYDPVEPTKVGGKVEEIVNYYIYKPNKDKILKPMPDFAGKLDNVDMSGRKDIDHFNIDKKPDLHKVAYSKVIELSDAAIAAAKAPAPKAKKK